MEDSSAFERTHLYLRRSRTPDPFHNHSPDCNPPTMLPSSCPECVYGPRHYSLIAISRPKQSTPSHSATTMYSGASFPIKGEEWTGLSKRDLTVTGRPTETLAYTMIGEVIDLAGLEEWLSHAWVSGRDEFGELWVKEALALLRLVERREKPLLNGSWGVKGGEWEGLQERSLRWTQRCVENNWVRRGSFEVPILTIGEDPDEVENSLKVESLSVGGVTNMGESVWNSELDDAGRVRG